MAIRLVIFDMAGTTVHDDNGVNRSLRSSLEAAGLTVQPADVNTVMGLPKREALRRLIERSCLASELLPRIELIHADFAARMRSFYASDPSVREVTGASVIFRWLHQAGIAVAVNTGFSRDIAQIILDRLGWERDQLIDASVTSDEVGRGRPHPDMIRYVMRRLGIANAEEVAKVGDTPADLEEGHHAGCGLVIGVTQGTHTREQLADFPHTHLMGSVAELPAVLGLNSVRLRVDG
jgi:phosphonatase-like hydrolase